ncbi:unnamed protein product [Didymodactylos carnosus]|uniref:G protein-coupled receptor n=1 Tax=Didymodactylos carnosus TaxID=1234261 RepID=A0A8S2KL49_9BILA|nr:unnamed protein product [Didymodactylos carnosus]CAF3859761.1 unnamed protein product [Didymodactylos carnosus]
MPCLTLMAIIYLWVWLYVLRQTATSTAQRISTINREFNMLKRIILPLATLTGLAIPYMILYAYENIRRGDIFYLSYHVSLLFVSFGLCVMDLVTLLLTPQIKTIFMRTICQIKQNMGRSISVIGNDSDVGDRATSAGNGGNGSRITTTATTGQKKGRNKNKKRKKNGVRPAGVCQSSHETVE